MKARLTAHYQVDVWEHRTEPPEDWNAKLPEHLEEVKENSYLHAVKENFGMDEELTPLQDGTLKLRSAIVKNMPCSIL